MKKLLTLVLALLIIVSACGCGSSYKDNIVYYELQSMPYNIDPQLASSDTELLISKNIFEGLMRMDIDGNLCSGVAESYSVSGNTYTFTLRDDLVWSDKETSLTAHDFVFAFRRALDPVTNAPSANKLLCVKNAASVLGGSMPTSALGVTAPDYKTLVIELEYAQENFLELLTLPICMPCNQKFFENCHGNYGMTLDTVISNGSYRLRRWDTQSNIIRISKNPYYKGDFSPENAAVMFSIDGEKTAMEQLKLNNVDIAPIVSADIGAVKEAGFKTVEFSNTCWLLTINNNKFSSDLRLAFALSFDRDKYKDALKDGYSVYEHIIPPALLGDTALSPATYPALDAKSIYSAEIAKLPNKSLGGIKIVYYNDPIISAALTDIAGNWQQKFGVTINIEPSNTLSTLQSQLKNPTYDMCLFPLTLSDGDIDKYLSYFGNFAATDLQQAQSAIFNACTVIPVAVQNTCYAYSDVLENVKIELKPGIIDFANIIKKD